VNPLHVVAAATVDDNTPWIGPGMIGFIVVVIIGVITWFLGRSMAKQLRKLDTDRKQREADGELENEAAEPAPIRDVEPNGAH
jgi:uncharacterized membrane-anchored protein YhcB (DUF1043 family)